MSCENERLAFEAADQKAKADANARDDARTASEDAARAYDEAQSQAESSLNAAVISYQAWVSCRNN